MYQVDVRDYVSLDPVCEVLVKLRATHQSVVFLTIPTNIITGAVNPKHGESSRSNGDFAESDSDLTLSHCAGRPGAADLDLAAPFCAIWASVSVGGEATRRRDEKVNTRSLRPGWPPRRPCSAP